jgi:hypothetical protein
MIKKVQDFLAAIAAIAVSVQVAAAQLADAPPLETNQSYVEGVQRSTTSDFRLDTKDAMAVFGFVMSKLPERVKVFPTENYYYFGFYLNGIRYAGNIRLDASNRDKGKADFGYFEDTSQWYDDAEVKHIELDAAHGVKVEKVEDLVYRVTFKDKSVVFALNDLRGVKPPADALGADEIYLGPVFDESAIQFYLVFNNKLKIFHYILNEQQPVPDSFMSPDKTNRVLVGKRTGFAFYRDHRLNRKILIGAFVGNIRANNYFDGPFDQLPDNFVEGDILRQAILQVQPSLKGKIDRFGGSPDGAVRFMISPYMAYKQLNELKPVHDCAMRKKKQPDYYRCFVTDDETGGMVEPPRKKSARKPR